MATLKSICMASFVLAGWSFLQSSNAYAQSFSCSYGQPACLDYGAKVCSSFAKCVSEDARESCHVLLENVAGVTVTGNTMCFGNDDDGSGPVSPRAGMVLRNLTNCVITGNTMQNGAVKTLIDDDGGHNAATLIRDNIGCLAPELPQ